MARMFRMARMARMARMVRMAQMVKMGQISRMAWMIRVVRMVWMIRVVRMAWMIRMIGMVDQLKHSGFILATDRIILAFRIFLFVKLLAELDRSGYQNSSGTTSGSRRQVSGDVIDDLTGMADRRF